MATKHQLVIPQQQQHRGGVIVPKGKQKNVGDGPDVKNRRALGDIGNLVAPEGKPQLQPQTQVTRPITRSFGAQLLANAQAAAALAANKKKLVSIAADGLGRKGPVKEVKQKVAVKSKPEVVIEIAPDTDAEAKKQLFVSKKGSSRKKVNTLTSVLTARSKAACGVNDKKKSALADIDASDVSDQLAVVDYVEDLYKFYKLSEHASRPHDYMDTQVELNAKMRAILADWLIEVHHKFELMPESLYLTFYIIDRYLSMETVVRRELQLVGLSAMLIACKYEEIWAPEVNDFICISDRAYNREQILATEKGILNKLEWSLTVPTPYVFLVRFIKAAMCDKEMEHMVFFFAEIGLMHYSMIMYCPSMIAASAVYAARCTLKKSPLWNDTLKCHTGFAEHQLLDCAKFLVKLHDAAPMDKLRFVFKKYSGAEFSGVALQPAATKMLQELNVN